MGTSGEKKMTNKDRPETIKKKKNKWGLWFSKFGINGICERLSGQGQCEKVTNFFTAFDRERKAWNLVWGGDPLFGSSKVFRFVRVEVAQASAVL